MTYDSRHAEKEKERRGMIRRRNAKKAGKWFVGLVILGAVIFVAAHTIRSFTPQGPDRSVGYSNLGQEHIAEGSPRPNYNSNPPTSGPHYDQPAKEQYYDHELPDERVVHNLEHGDIWISYQPGIPPSVIDELKSLADGVYVIITPRGANDADIAVAAWTRLDKFNLNNGALDIQRIKDFILRYEDQGPEKVHMAAVPQ